MKIHILGIAGTFMSGIAILAKKKGHVVTGSDTACYDPIKSILKKENIDVINRYKFKDLNNKYVTLQSKKNRGFLASGLG